MNTGHRPRRLTRLVPLLAGVTAVAVAVGGNGAVSFSATRSAVPLPPTVLLGLYGAPVQNGVAGPDSPTSFSATLPNGRRITPAGTSVQVGEQALNSVLTPDGQYLITTNDDERNGGNTSTQFSRSAVNGAGKVLGGFVLSSIRTSDMSVMTYTVAPANTTGNPGVRAPGVTQSDRTGTFFLGVAIKGNSPPYTVYAAGGPSDLVNVYTLDAGGMLARTASISVPVPTDRTRPNFGMSSPGGLALSADQSRLYVVNNNGNTVATIDTATNQVIGAPVSVGYFPYTGVLSPDGGKLYVSNWGVADRHFNSAYLSSATVDASGNVSGTGTLMSGDAAGMFRNPVIDPARSSSVSVINLSSGAVGSIPLGLSVDGVNIVGGTHPSAMATVVRGGQSALYVADANEDALAVINTANDTLVRKVPVRMPVPLLGDQRVPGITPNALAVSPDNTRLYVAEAGLNAVSVYDVSQPFSPRFLGRIPTGWYPTGVTLSPDGRALYITNEKGFGNDYGFQGSVPGNPLPGSSPDVNLTFGSVQKVDLTTLDLGAATRQVSANTYRLNLFRGTGVLNAIRPNIQHIIYILRENKSYDIYFGADGTLNARGANGNPAYANFDPQVPNAKALAEQFAIGDNAYADSEESNAGHSFALAGTSTDYQQKTLLSRFARPLLNIKNEDPEDYPLTGYIFNNAARSGVSYRDYGDMIRVSGYDDGGNPNPCADDPGYPSCATTSYTYTNTTAPTVGFGGLYAEDVPALAALNSHIDPNYPGWSLRISDQRRAKEFIKDYSALIAAGLAPQFTFIWLPDDHTGNAGGMTINPRFQVADSDAALGQIVDFVSHSSIWPTTAMFLTEDDTQSSPDHVYAHRTYTMVMSPYARHGAVIHRLSSTVSIPKTIEEILRMQPMNLGDLLANDLSDYFTTTPDLTPYSARPQAQVAAAPVEAMRIADLTSQLDMRTYDADNARLGQIQRLFFASEALAKRQAHMSPLAYYQAQKKLYREALRVVGTHAPNHDPDGF